VGDWDGGVLVVVLGSLLKGLRAVFVSLSAFDHPPPTCLAT